MTLEVGGNIGLSPLQIVILPMQRPPGSLAAVVESSPGVLTSDVVEAAFGVLTSVMLTVTADVPALGMLVLTSVVPPPVNGGDGVVELPFPRSHPVDVAVPSHNCRL
jgi:hypothetical protein